MMSRVLKTATALLAFMLMASVAVWAAPAVTAPTVSVDGATGNVTVSTQINDGGTPLPGKQVTMLTYLGTPTDTSIIGIDQDASDTNGNKSFTFGTDGTTPNGTYTVLVGGEDVNTAASATMDFTKSIDINPVPSPVPVNQPVTLTAVAKLNGTENVSYNSAITWSADGGTITPDTANPAQATFTAAAAGTYTVTATLGDVSNTTSVVVGEGQPTGHKITGTVGPMPDPNVAYPDAAALAGISVSLRPASMAGTSTDIKTATVAANTGNPTTANFEIDGVADGNYAIAISKPGYLTRYVPVTVSGGDVVVEARDLWAGDLNQDMSIDGIDLMQFFTVFNQDIISNPGTYTITCDFNADGSIDGIDLTNEFAKFNLSVYDYGESIDPLQ